MCRIFRMSSGSDRRTGSARNESSSGCRVIFWDVGGTLVDFAGPSLAHDVRRRLGGCGMDESLLRDERIDETFVEFFAAEREWRTFEDEAAACMEWARRLLG